jgi:Ribbon-helix-helix protein, copG family
MDAIDIMDSRSQCIRIGESLMGYAKLSVNLSDDLLQVLQELATARGTTQTEVLRQAISTEAMLQEAVNQGSRVLIQDPKGRMRQVLMRPVPGSSSVQRPAP